MDINTKLQIVEKITDKKAAAWVLLLNYHTHVSKVT